MIIVIVFALLGLLLLLRMPIAFAMGVSGMVGMAAFLGPLPAVSILDRHV